jgi:type II secretory pathway component PulC
MKNGGAIGAGGGAGLTQGAPLRQPGEFAYQVKGVIVGKKPMAVFEDDNGNQRLVPLGGSLDGDSKVVAIEKGKVRIRHHGKEKTLDLPEGP